MRNPWLREATFGLIIAAIAVALLTAVIAGCGESGPTLIPVAGKVTIDGQPATEGGVVYHDAATGLTQLVGSIMSDGTYFIRHRREVGAPAGKYRVTVLVTKTPKDLSGNPIDLPKMVSNRKYMDPKTTSFEVEVAEGASLGAYDFAVTR